MVWKIAAFTHVLTALTLKGLMRFSQAFERKKFQMPDFTP
jgi:hypothetical protein